MSPAASDGFTLHPEAARELTQLWEYLANINLAAAGRVRAEILEAIRAMVPHPHRGHRRPDLTARPLRFLPTGARTPAGPVNGRAHASRGQGPRPPTARAGQSGRRPRHAGCTSSGA